MDLLETTFPNVVVALKILLTQPVTVVTVERNFSKLKLIKTYLRSTIGQTRIVDLATIPKEKDTVYQCDYTKMIEDFANKKARRVAFAS